jgi:hypothetical protein
MVSLACRNYALACWSLGLNELFSRRSSLAFQEFFVSGSTSRPIELPITTKTFVNGSNVGLFPLG